MIWSNWYRNGQIHPSGFKDAGSCVAQQTRLSLGWTGAKHLSMDLASGPPQQQDSHVFMPHNSTLWLFRIRCVKTLMNCLLCDEIRSWLCVDRDQSWCYQPPLFQPWLLVWAVWYADIIVRKSHSVFMWGFIVTLIRSGLRYRLHLNSSTFTPASSGGLSWLMWQVNSISLVTIYLCRWQFILQCHFYTCYSYCSDN